jgi:hypothetical protein
MSEKNEPLVKLMCQVLNEKEWQNGDTSRFARVFSACIGETISRNTVYAWLIQDGIPPKYLPIAVDISKRYGGNMTAKELRPDLPEIKNYHE